MRSVTVVFTKSKKKFPIFSWLIMLWTWKSYSHVALKVDLSWLEGSMYFQASEGKVNYEYESHFLRENEIIKSYQIEIPKDIYSKLAAERMKSAGENYGFMQNVGIVLVDICKLFGKEISNPWKKGKNCSELIYNLILKPLNPELNFDPETIKPHHVERIIKELLSDG